MSNKRTFAAIAATAVVGAIGIGGLATANAATTPPSHANTTNGPEIQAPEDTEAPEGNEVAEGADEADGPDQGPDANPTAPGHQDADESGESEATGAAG